MSGNTQAMLIIQKGKMKMKIMTMYRIVVDQVMLMYRWAIRQQDNLDPDVTLGVAGTERQTLPRKRRIADLMDDVYALWMRSSRMGKKKTEDVHASSLSSNEDIEKWLESMENPETNENLG